MNLNELHVTGFGKWRNQTFTFTPGLNICTAPNESGKTTLLQAIFAALYGLKRDYVRVTRYLEEYEQYLPWDHGSYETIVHYTLQNQNFRLHRNFVKDKEFAKLYQEPDLQELNALYQEDKRKEFNFIEKHLGLTRTIFMDVTWVRSQPLAASERLVSTLSRDQREDPIMRQLTNGLDAELTSIGKKENAENTQFGKASKQLLIAKQALFDAEQAWQSVQHLTQEAARWQAQLELALVEKRQMHTKREQLEQRKKMVQYWWQLSYQTQTASDLLLWMEHAATEEERSYHRRIRELLQDLDELEQQYQTAKNLHENKNREHQENRENHPFFLRFAEIEDTEWQAWLKNWYALAAYQEEEGKGGKNGSVSASSVDLDKLQADYRQGLELRRQIEEQRRRHARLLASSERVDHTGQIVSSNQTGPSGQTFLSSSSDPTTSSSSQADESAWSSVGRSRSLKVRGRMVKYRQRQRKLWATSALLATTAVAAEILYLSKKDWFEGFELTIQVFVGLLALLAVGLTVKALSNRSQQPRLTNTADPSVPTPALDAEILSLLHVCDQEIKELEEKLTAITEDWGTPSWEEFLLKREEYLLHIHQLQMSKQAQNEQARLKLRMEQKMLAWGVPQHLSFEEAVQLVLQERQEWERRVRDEQEKLESELAEERQRLQVTEKYEQAVIQRQAALREWEEITRGRLQKEQTQLDQELAECAKKLQQCEATIGELREWLARAAGEIGQRDQVSWAKAKSVYDEAVEQVNQLQKRRDALALAQEMLGDAWKEWHRELSPDINDAASLIMQQITQGKYGQVRLDPLRQYSIRVIEPHTRDVIEQHQLSSGTQDQLYLAQRIALLRHISKEKEPLPLFLDDHFIHYDEARLAETLHYIAQLAEEHQVFLFSCQSREQKILDSLLTWDGRHQKLLLEA